MIQWRGVHISHVEATAGVLPRSWEAVTASPKASGTFREEGMASATLPRMLEGVTGIS